MSRITNILSNIRVDLGDTSAQRYTDDILVRHLNRAILDFVIATKCLRERIYLGLNTSTTFYDLSKEVLEFIRVEYLGKNINALSYDELDAINIDWQNEIGTEVKYVTFDHLGKGKIRVYPKVKGTLDIITQNSLYGGLIDIIIGEENYQIPSISDVEANIHQYLVCYVVKKPNIITIDTLDKDLELSESYDTALETYIMALCLRSDTDANNRAYGNEQLQLYNNYVVDTIRNISVDNNIIHDRVIRYNGGWNE